MGHWPQAMRAIKDADVILLILDARSPELSRNKDLERKLKETGKEFWIVFNKTDLISPERLKELKARNRDAFFVSAVSREGIGKLRESLVEIAKREEVKLEVGIVGYPNVGKSMITNSLAKAHKATVSSKAGTTVGVQWVSSEYFKIIDSPGVIPFEDDEVKLGILGAKNPEKLVNSEAVALEIIAIFLDDEPKKLEKAYGIVIEKSDEEYEIMLKIGMAKKLLKKGGVVDEGRTALMIIREWQLGKLRV